MDKVISGALKKPFDDMAQIVIIGFLLAGPAGDKILPHTTDIGLTLLWVAAVITLYTGYDYFKAGMRHIVD